MSHTAAFVYGQASVAYDLETARQDSRMTGARQATIVEKASDVFVCVTCHKLAQHPYGNDLAIPGYQLCCNICTEEILRATVARIAIVPGCEIMAGGRPRVGNESWVIHPTQKRDNNYMLIPGAFRAQNRKTVGREITPLLWPIYDAMMCELLFARCLLPNTGFAWCGLGLQHLRPSIWL